MNIFKRILFAYYWTKGEKAMGKDDYETANLCKEKLNNLRKKEERL